MEAKSRESQVKRIFEVPVRSPDVGSDGLVQRLTRELPLLFITLVPGMQRGACDLIQNTVRASECRCPYNSGSVR